MRFKPGDLIVLRGCTDPFFGIVLEINCMDGMKVYKIYWSDHKKASMIEAAYVDREYKFAY